MLEQVKRHVEEYKLLEDSAIPLCLLYEKGKDPDSGVNTGAYDRNDHV